MSRNSLYLSLNNKHFKRDSGKRVVSLVRLFITKYSSGFLFGFSGGTLGQVFSQPSNLLGGRMYEL